MDGKAGVKEATCRPETVRTGGEFCHQKISNRVVDEFRMIDSTPVVVSSVDSKLRLSGVLHAQ